MPEEMKALLEYVTSIDATRKKLLFDDRLDCPNINGKAERWVVMGLASLKTAVMQLEMAAEEAKSG